MGLAAFRIPPLPESYTSDRTPRGTCRWCEKEILDGKGDLIERRRWHKDCQWDAAYYLRPDVVRDYVDDRDNGRCASCGESKWQLDSWCRGHGNWERWDSDTLRFVPVAPENIIAVWEARNRPCGGLIDEGVRAWGPICVVTWSPDWQVDHIIPLWKVADLPDDKRIWYFEMENLQTLCTACHKVKSALEAIERAKMKRIKQKDGLRRKDKQARAPLPF